MVSPSMGASVTPAGSDPPPPALVTVMARLAVAEAAFAAGAIQHIRSPIASNRVMNNFIALVLTALPLR